MLCERIHEVVRWTGRDAGAVTTARRRFGHVPAPSTPSAAPGGRAFHWSGNVQVLRERYVVLGPAVSLAAHTLVTLTPAADLVPWAVANGAIYGVALGAFLSWLAWLGAALVHFELARRAAATFDVAAHVARLPAWLQRVPVHHPCFLICGRWIPTGALVTAVAAGALGVPRARLLCCAALGSAPPAVVLAVAGSGAWRALA